MNRLRRLQHFRFSSSAIPAQLDLSTLSNVITLEECQAYTNFDARVVGDLKQFAYKQSSQQGKPIVAQIQDPVFYDFSGNKIYSNDTPFDIVASSNFFVLSKDDSKLIAVLQNTPYDRSSVQSTTRSAINTLCTQFNLNKTDSGVLSDYVTRFSAQLLNSSYSQVDTQYIQMVNRKVLTEISLASKRRIGVYDSLLRVLESKLKSLNDTQKELDATSDAKSHKYLKRIFALALSKVFMLQYCTYVLLSWDIMEPITCLFGIFDIGLAYFFWMLTHSELDYDNLKQRYLNKRRMNLEAALLSDTIQRTQDLITYINEQKDAESPSLSTLLSNM